MDLYRSEQIYIDLTKTASPSSFWMVWSNTAATSQLKYNIAAQSALPIQIRYRLTPNPRIITGSLLGVVFLLNNHSWTLLITKTIHQNIHNSTPLRDHLVLPVTSPMAHDITEIPSTTHVPLNFDIRDHLFMILNPPKSSF